MLGIICFRFMLGNISQYIFAIINWLNHETHQHTKGARLTCSPQPYTTALVGVLIALFCGYCTSLLTVCRLPISGVVSSWAAHISNLPVPFRGSPCAWNTLTPLSHRHSHVHASGRLLNVTCSRKLCVISSPQVALLLCPLHLGLIST